MLQESQRPPSSARPRDLMSEERPARRETVRRAGQEEERTRQNGVPGVIGGKFSVRSHARNPQKVASEN
jgi:hypothetical protein